MFCSNFFYVKKRPAEFKDDSQIIPRSSSVVVKRLPSARPGKGKASMYIAGVGNALPVSDKSGGPSNGSTSWHKGAMSKRFDVKDENPASTAKSSPVSCVSMFMSLVFYVLQSGPTSIKSSVTNDDEQAAVAAMFQAQTANWEETQEKMSQLVPPYAGFCQRSRPISNEHCLFLPLLILRFVLSQCSAYIHQSAWHWVLTRWWQAPYTSCSCPPTS